MSGLIGEKRRKMTMDWEIRTSYGEWNLTPRKKKDHRRVSP